MRTADSVLLTCWPPAPLDRYTSISRSAGLISMWMSSSTSGETNTEANDVCRRLLESKISARKPCLSAHLRYMRRSICAQSWASVPPAPAWISTKALCESISPGNIRANSSFWMVASSGPRSFSTAASVPASPSSSASSASAAASLRPPVRRSSVSTVCSSRARSRPNSCALSGFVQIAGSSSSRRTSSSRSFLLSYSKVPPESDRALFKVLQVALELGDFHRTAMLTEMLHDQLQPLEPLVLVDVEPIGELHPPGDHRQVLPVHGEEIERDAVDNGRVAVRPNPQLQMAFADDARIEHREAAIEYGFGKSLPPRSCRAQRLRRRERHFRWLQLAVGQHAPFGILRFQVAADLLGEAAAKLLEPLALQGEAGGHRVAAELFEQSRFALGDGIECIAQVHAGHRTRGTTQPAGVGGSERDDRTMQALLGARRNEADDARMPLFIEKAQAERQAGVIDLHALHDRGRLLVHPALDRSPLGIQPAELGGKETRARRVVGQQALDAERHVVEAAGRVQSRRRGESEIGCDAAFGAAAAFGEQCADAGHAVPGADALQAL